MIDTGWPRRGAPRAAIKFAAWLPLATWSWLMLVAWAGDLTVGSFSLRPLGGSSRGQDFSLRAEVATPAPTAAAGGGFVLVASGSALFPPAPSPPTLSVERSGGDSIVVKWVAEPGLFHLEECTNLVSPAWQDTGLVVSSNAQENRVLIPRDTGARFYRLRGATPAP
jgi:hypothetical protein